MKDNDDAGPLEESSPVSPIVTVSDLELAYGPIPVLEDVSFAVDRGEFVGLVGPNGAGKTTLLRALTGAIEPATGGVRIDGTDITNCRSRTSSRLVSVVPQDTSLSFSFDVRTVVEMGRHPHRSRFAPPSAVDRRHVRRALERTRTAQFADRAIDAVSGGERQRVLFARAIAQDTPLMVLDEPTASLDVNHRIETLELARELVDDGRTIVAAIHDLELAARYCDRLCLLANGTLQADGNPADVVTASTLASAFDAEAVVGRNPVTGTPTVTAFGAAGDDEGDEPDESALAEAHVHIVGTGSFTTGLLARLEGAAGRVSVGPAPEGGIVTEHATRRGLECVQTEAFGPVTAGDRTDVASLCEAADAVVLADVTLTAGNQLLLESLESVAPVVAVDRRPLEERLQAGDEAAARYRAAVDRQVDQSGDGMVHRWARLRQVLLEVSSESPVGPASGALDSRGREPAKREAETPSEKRADPSTDDEPSSKAGTNPDRSLEQRQND